MNKAELKKEILESGISKQQNLIDNFEHRMDELRSGEKLLNESQYDAQQASHNVEMNEQINLLSNQLHFAQEEMDLLQRLNVDAPLHDSVHFGSVVETDNMVFYISVSLEEFVADGNKYFGISTKAPIYKEMLGKKIGDSFSMNNKQYRITDIY